MKQRMDIGNRVAGEKAKMPDEFITASQSSTRYQLKAEFNGQTLFELDHNATIEFQPLTERQAAYLSVNGVSYWQPLSFSFVESNGKLYVSWSSSISLATSDDIYLVRQ